MKRKLVGIFVLMLLIVTVFPIMTNTADNRSNNIVNNHSILGMPLSSPFDLSLKNNASIQKDECKETPVDKGWYWMSIYPNYAPSGMPDFTQKQGEWKHIFDMGNGVADTTAVPDDIQIIQPGEKVGEYQLVIGPGPNCCLESEPENDDKSKWSFCSVVSLANCYWWLDSKFSDSEGFPGDGEDEFPLVKGYESNDDHAPDNVPLLVCDLANEINIIGDLDLKEMPNLIKNGIEDWFQKADLDQVFAIQVEKYPDFNDVAQKITNDQVVMLCLTFYTSQWTLLNSHAVTCAGVNPDELKIAISDPMGGSTKNNDAQYVSHTQYEVAIGSPNGSGLPCKFYLPKYGSLYNTVVEHALYISSINAPPNAPLIGGPRIGKLGIDNEYTFEAMDPDGNDIKYFIDWGDGNTGWTDFYKSGTRIILKKNWSKTGVYDIKTKAKDTNYLTSGWDKLTVVIPRDKPFNYNQHGWLFERFPLLERLMSLIKVI